MDLIYELHQAYELSLSAYHEVGHLVVARHFDIQVDRIWLDGVHGRIKIPNQTVNLLHYSVMLGGGSASECRLLKKPASWRPGSESDQEKIQSFGIEIDMGAVIEHAASIVRLQWDKVVEVSELFLQRLVLEKSDIDSLF